MSLTSPAQKNKLHPHKPINMNNFNCTVLFEVLTQTSEMNTSHCPQLLFPSEKDNIQAPNTCFSVSTSSLFVKSMNHLDGLKKAEVPKMVSQWWSVSSRKGAVTMTALLFPSL